MGSPASAKTANRSFSTTNTICGRSLDGGTARNLLADQSRREEDAAEDEAGLNDRPERPHRPHRADLVDAAAVAETGRLTYRSRCC
jgi:hypothetical protein